jgi:hypothetical protein
MGVGYQVSPLHKIAYADPVEDAPVKPPPPHILWLTESMPPDMPRMRWDGRPLAFRSPALEDIIAWRAAFSRRHQAELGEELDWDEQSYFEQSEDNSTESDTLFRYVTAIIGQHGVGGLAALVGLTAPPDGAKAAVFAEADRRGSAVRFPQLLMGVRYWLPIKSNIVITSTTWRGDVARFGSVSALAGELNEIRAAIVQVDPSISLSPADGSVPRRDVLSSAWQAGDRVSRLAALALTHGLPLWTTG